MELPDSDTTAGRFLFYGVPLFAIAVLALVALTVLDAGPFADDALSEQEFIAQADQICREAHDQYNEAQLVAPRTTEEASELAQRLLDISLQEQDAIRELTPPDELEAPLDAYLQAREEAFVHLRNATEAAAEGDDQRYAQADRELEAGAEEREELASAVGFEVCGHPTPKPEPEPGG